MKIYLLAATTILLAACTVRTDVPNRVTIDSDGVTIDSRGGYHSHGGQRFCPPGQAKKGNC